jgi:carnitine-CoA ligase
MVDGQNLTQPDMINYCKGGIGCYKILGQVSFVKEYPMTSLGKIHKHKLKCESLDQLTKIMHCEKGQYIYF